jgi:hypothetical protein
MGLNIKDREAHLLAEELSKETGERTAVTIALRERLTRVALAPPPSDRTERTASVVEDREPRHEPRRSRRFGESTFRVRPRRSIKQSFFVHQCDGHEPTVIRRCRFRRRSQDGLHLN